MKQNCSQNIIHSVRLNSERLFKLTDENHHRLERSWKRFKFLLVPEGIRSVEWTIVQWKNVPGSLIIYGNLNDWNGQYGLKCEWLCQQNDLSPDNQLFNYPPTSIQHVWTPLKYKCWPSGKQPIVRSTQISKIFLLKHLTRTKIVLIGLDISPDFLRLASKLNLLISQRGHKHSSNHLKICSCLEWVSFYNNKAIFYRGHRVKHAIYISHFSRCPF